jgi:Tol biopolymer transport system component
MFERQRRLTEIAMRMGLAVLAVIIFVALTLVPAAPQKPGETADALYGAALHLEQMQGQFEQAIAAYQKVITAPGVTRLLAARAQLHIGICYERLGNRDARQAYEKVIRDFADQPAILREAQTRLAAMSRPGATIGAVIRQVLLGDELGSPGPPSPDGRHLAFFAAKTGDIAIFEIATAAIRKITHFQPKGEDAEFALEMQWSPDGERIAYTHLARSERFTDLRIVSVRDQSYRSVYHGTEGELSLGSWTPNGQSMLVRDCCNFLMVSVKDGSANLLRKMEVAPSAFALSPDGLFVAYQHDSGAGAASDINLFPVKGGPDTPIVKHGADDQLFDWCPDGGKLLFTSDRRGTVDLWAVAMTDGLARGDPELVKSDLGEISPLGITRAGNIFYARKTRSQDVYVAGLDFETGRVLEHPTRVHPSRVGDSIAPAWSPDGHLLAYLRQLQPASGAADLCVWELENGSHHQVKLDAPIPADSLSWSPDQTQVWATGVRLEPAGFPKALLWRIDPKTGHVLGESEHPAGVSPDGRLIWERRRDQTKGAWIFSIRNAQDGKITEIYRTSGPNDILSLLGNFSPDGGWVSFGFFPREPNRPATRTFIAAPVTGGAAREVFRFDEKITPLSLDWAPDSRSIFCVVAGQAGRDASELWKSSVETGKQQKMDLSVGNVRGIALHPDGKHLAYSTFVTGPWEVWEAQNLISTPARLGSNRQR